MKKYIIAGLLVWLPLAITIWVLLWILGLMDGVFQTLLGAATAVLPHGASAMLGIRLSSTDAETVAKTLVALGGKDAGASPFNEGDRRVDFGQTWIDVAPEGVAGGRAGGGIVEVVLASSEADLPSEGKLLDLGLAHGAPIRLVRG